MLMQKRPIGTIAYVGRGSNAEDFTWAWSQLVQYTFEHLSMFCNPEKETIYVLRGSRSGQYFTRNWLAQAQLGDWVLMLDNDHTFEPDLLWRMLRVFNRPDFPIDVLCGLYQYRGSPYNPVLYHYDEKVEGYVHITHQATTEPLQIGRIGAAGGGHLMVRRRVFDRIRDEMKQKPFNPYDPWGEDFAFFERLRVLGIPVWCCPDIQSYHLRVEETTMEDFDPRLVKALMDVQCPGSPPPLMQPEPPEMWP